MSDDPEMTEPGAVAIPGKKTAPARTRGEGGSLFERASSSFGLDSLTPPPPPRVDGDSAKKFAPRRAPVSAGAETQPTTVAAPDPVAAVPARESVAPAADAHPAVRFTAAPRGIVRSLLGEQGLIDPDGGTSALLEEFRIVKRQLLGSAQAADGGLARRILVCSPHPNEGKTFCALNLALAMAGERDSEVVLVDADFAKPSIMARLGLAADEGLMDVLSDPARRIEDHVIVTDIPGLFVLPAGRRTGRDAEYLASARTGEVLARLMQGAPNRYLIFDSPPALAASPAAELAKHVGQALLVARADMTGKASLEDALDLLSACPDIKLLLNDATFSPSGRRFGSYYGYGE